MSDTATKHEVLLRVDDLVKHFPIRGGLFKQVKSHVRAVDHVSFEIERGKVLGIVGESGCGKTTLGRTVLRLTPRTAGKVYFKDKDIFEQGKGNLLKLRTKMQIIFQDPYSSLNPRLPVNEIIGEALVQHGMVKNKSEMMDRVIDIIEKCGLFPEQACRYPHQFSGGQRQRICIARALVLNPEFVVCDVTVSALDVSIQSQIINLLKEMQEHLGLTYLFISHDLSVVRFISDQVGVMYLGELVEYGEKTRSSTLPAPYTGAPVSSADIRFRRTAHAQAHSEGRYPFAGQSSFGCRFHTRCPFAQELCSISRRRT